MNRSLNQSLASLLLGSVVILAGAPQTFAGGLCRPLLIVKSVAFSELSPAQRQWTARFTVDASRCAASSGRFTVDFVRLKETAPDLRFTEQFTWREGETDISADFAADESVLSYSVSDVGPCPCRQ